MEREAGTVVAGGVYDMPFPPADYRGIYMVADDGVLLVEIRVHKRAQERDLVPELRAWHERVTAKEEAVTRRGRLTLITPDAGVS